MRKSVLSVAMMVVIGAPEALAQGGSSTATKNADRPQIQAPVGHRQPRASDFPDEKNLSNPDTTANKEDAALDKKIKSICRGC